VGASQHLDRLERAAVDRACALITFEALVRVAAQRRWSWGCGAADPKAV